MLKWPRWLWCRLTSYPRRVVGATNRSPSGVTQNRMLSLSHQCKLVLLNRCQYRSNELSVHCRGPIPYTNSKRGAESPRAFKSIWLGPALTISKVAWSSTCPLTVRNIPLTVLSILTTEKYLSRRLSKPQVATTWPQLVQLVFYSFYNKSGSVNDEGGSTA